MGLRCKVGDKAVSIGRNKLYDGIVFEILAEAPSKSFKLPNGVLRQGCEAGSWIVKASRFMPVNNDYGETRRSLYGVAPDVGLRPLNGDQPEAVV